MYTALRGYGYCSSVVAFNRRWRNSDPFRFYRFLPRRRWCDGCHYHHQRKNTRPPRHRDVNNSGIAAHRSQHNVWTIVPYDQKRNRYPIRSFRPHGCLHHHRHLETKRERAGEAADEPKAAHGGNRRRGCAQDDTDLFHRLRSHGNGNDGAGNNAARAAATPSRPGAC